MNCHGDISRIPLILLKILASFCCINHYTLNPLAPTIPICSQAVWRRQFPYVPKKLRFSPPLLLQSVAQPSCGRLKNRKVQRLSHLLGLYLSIFNNPRCVINYIYSRVCKIKLIRVPTDIFLSISVLFLYNFLEISVLFLYIFLAIRVISHAICAICHVISVVKYAL